MNIKYRQLKAFSLAAQLGSFSEAADAMAVTQPSFSNLIKELEADLGVQLFDRTSRRSLLTDAGRSFQGQVAAALEHLETVYRGMTQTGRGERGRLSIATLASLSFGIIPKAIAQFRARFPEVQIVLHERKNVDVFQAVREREVELGMGCLLQPDDALHFQPMFTDRLMLVVPEGHPLATGRATWRSLESYPYIFMRTGPSEHAIRAKDLRVAPAFEVEHVATAVAMVRHGIGITALPSSVFPALNLEGVRVVPIVGRLATRTLGVATRSGSPLSGAARNFVDLVRGTAPTDLTGWQPYPASPQSAARAAA